MFISKRKSFVVMLAIVALFWNLFTAISFVSAAPSVSGPSKLTAKIVDNGVKLTWQNNGPYYGNIRILRFEGKDHTLSQEFEVSKTSTSFVDTTVKNGVTYQYQLVVLGRDGREDWNLSSNEVTIKYLKKKPGAPTNLQAEIVDTGVLLTWQDNTGGGYWFRIEREDDEPLPVPLQPFQTVENAISFIDTNVQHGKTYHYTCYAQDVDVDSDKSNTVTITYYAFPDKPTNLQATVVAEGIELSWTDNSDNENIFTIERSEEGNDGPGYIFEVASNTTTYLDTEVEDGSTYTYFVYGQNEAGASSFSNEVTITYLKSSSNSDQGKWIKPAASGLAVAVIAFGVATFFLRRKRKNVVVSVGVLTAAIFIVSLLAWYNLGGIFGAGSEITLSPREQRGIEADLERLAYANSIPLQYENMSSVIYDSLSEQTKLNFLCAYTVYGGGNNVFVNEDDYFADQDVWIGGSGGFIVRENYVNQLFKKMFGRDLIKNQLYADYDAETLGNLNMYLPAGCVHCSAPTGVDSLDYRFVKLQYNSRTKVYTMTIAYYDSEESLIGVYQFSYFSNGYSKSFKGARFISFILK